jgi:hypothetical protein
MPHLATTQGAVLRGGTAQREILLAAGFRMGREAGIRAVSAALAERDRALAELRAEFDRDIGEMRTLLDEVVERLLYLRELEAAMRAAPLGPLH